MYRQRIPTHSVTTSEFAQRLGAISTEIDRPVCAYLNRRGQAIRVGVGTLRQTQIPPLEIPRYGSSRLSGIRCIATQQKWEPPDTSTLAAMAMQRLDVLALLLLSGEGFQRRGGGAAGYVRETYLAHLAPPSEYGDDCWSVLPSMSLDALSQQDFLGLVNGLEEEFQREAAGRQVEVDRDLALLVGVRVGDRGAAVFEEGLAELARLVETAGGTVLQTMRQQRSHPHPQTVVGAGKVEEIALAGQTLGANLIVFDRDLSPAQARNLEVRAGIRVCDRTEVILDIFAQRARSHAGKLQVELAQLEYLLPRLAGRGRAMSRLGGGIGTRGPGETKLEMERRAIQKRISRLQQQVDRLQAHRDRLRHKRYQKEVPSVAIAGYTNAGKSTLLNTLTNANTYTADQLFATLDPTTRRLAIFDPTAGQHHSLVLTDTVGFIRDLPPPLMDAFRATLEEVTEADAILHVVDLSHPDWENQVASVMDEIAKMPVVSGPVLMAFNKVDRADPEAIAIAQSQYPQAAFISALENTGLDELRSMLLQLVRYAAV